mmetsp:Transcript_4949/g.7486  ORF Transcript_4949/g.7486 Transcript_4949/m.7486 type:complete len:200 (-) Transcript_4949:93-692(-)|eukprot:CAMPEP_0113939868 /NCGR_PEP_ID=MMETSP1339-20121228/6108_1 /TAXON_ID=94617 /ORGANISM="Fibrocapsa japonica" /LENGTH=199 /DNA_ID=CAMNT_0000943499 /DNA_START=162 /DNA_END=761 /DNA_ORIENTATION=- /assembly_acc=CAM_ASM_000762
MEVAKENVASAANEQTAEKFVKSGLSAEEENMTVEQYLQQKCEILIQELKGHADGLCQKLREEYEEGAKEIKQAIKDQAGHLQEWDLEMVAVKGVLEGKTFTLHPRHGADPLLIGRSGGKKFRENGMCLKKDSEVSTTHAKIFSRGGKVFLVDNGSTNGTVVNGKKMEEGDPAELSTGTRITLGRTLFEANLTPISTDG